MLSGLDSGGIRVELLRPADLFAGGVSRLGLKPDARDAKQRALGDILEHLPRSGDFAVMELPRSLTVAGSAFALTSELERPALAFFLPLYSGEHQSLPGRVLVTLTSLEDLEIQAAASEAALLEATREKFGGMSLYRRGLVALLNRDGEILASGGDGQLPRESLAPALEEARRTGRAQVTLPSAYGDLLCLVSYSRAFDWYTAMGRAAVRNPRSVRRAAFPPVHDQSGNHAPDLSARAVHAHALAPAAGPADAQNGRAGAGGLFRAGRAGKTGTADGAGASP